MSLYTGALDHELCPPHVEINLLGERLVLQGSCAFLTLLMVNIVLILCGSMLGLLYKVYITYHPSPSFQSLEGVSPQDLAGEAVAIDDLRLSQTGQGAFAWSTLGKQRLVTTCPVCCSKHKRCKQKGAGLKKPRTGSKACWFLMADQHATVELLLESNAFFTRFNH